MSLRNTEIALWGWQHHFYGPFISYPMFTSLVTKPVAAGKGGHHHGTMRMSFAGSDPGWGGFCPLRSHLSRVERAMDRGRAGEAVPLGLYLLEESS